MITAFLVEAEPAIYSVRQECRQNPTRHKELILHTNKINSAQRVWIDGFDKSLGKKKSPTTVGDDHFGDVET